MAGRSIDLKWPVIAVLLLVGLFVGWQSGFGVARGPKTSGTVAFSNRGLVTEYETLAICEAPAVDIGNLVDIMALLHNCHKDRDPNHRAAIALVDRLFAIDRRHGAVVLPDSFKAKVMGWLGNNALLFAEVSDQSITSVFNRLTHEASVFNPLRGKRPGAGAGASPETIAYMKKITDDTRGDCDFCRYAQSTAMDVFGRIESEFAITAANTFKYESLHTLVMFRHHDPLVWTKPQFMDLMHTATKWFAAAYKSNPQFAYPHLMWDLFPRASASQLHPHTQCSLGPYRYYGLGEDFRITAEEYLHTYHTNYFRDLAQAHSALGLAYELGEATALAYLTPKKENEVLLLAPTAGDDLFALLHHVLRAFIDDMSIFSFSLAFFFPAMDPLLPSLPALVRIVDRGSPSVARSDISAMELFAMSNVNSDPFSVMAKLRASIQKQLKVNSN